MGRQKIGWSRGNETPPEAYDAFCRRLNPTVFEAREWISFATAAGFRYLVFTANHHDDFALWPSAISAYDIVGRSL